MNDQFKTEATHREARVWGTGKYLEDLKAGKDLAQGQAGALLGFLRSTNDSAHIESVLRRWSKKGFTATEIAECAAILRRDAIKVSCPEKRFVDIVGTGGGRAKTFNVSTAAAFAAAGAGLVVTKHGNRAATSLTGSADALAELGVDLAAEPSAAELCLAETGMCFMFAPKFHRLSVELADARKRIGAPTIFNLLGPLANPAGAPFQIIGIWDGSLLDVYAEAVRLLGTQCTWIVHGSDGLDEITVTGPTGVREIRDGRVTRFEVDPSDFGVRTGSTSRIRDRSAVESASFVRGVLDGSKRGVAADLVKINAAAALFVAGLAGDLKNGVELATFSIESGRALRKLDLLVEMTNS